MLAIVIPYYKYAFFQETLESLKCQINKNFNVYVGNDASPESPDKLIQQYQKDFNLLYKKFENNLGGVSLIKHWERCIDMIGDEDWLMVLGDDDVLGENVVNEFYCRLQNGELGDFNVVRFSALIIRDRTIEPNTKTSNPLIESAIKSYYRKAIGKTRSSMSEYIFTKKAYNEKGFFPYPMAWCSDDRAWIDFSLGENIYSINSALVQVRVSNLSLSGSAINSSIKSTTEIKFKKWFFNTYQSHLTKKEKLKYLFNLEGFMIRNRVMVTQEVGFFFKQYSKNFEIFFFLKFLRRLILYYFVHK